ncbi:MAG: hypothetical protein WC975_01045 [Phycisphaerae bacterium]
MDFIDFEFAAGGMQRRELNGKADKKGTHILLCVSAGKKPSAATHV